QQNQTPSKPLTSQAQPQKTPSGTRIDQVRRWLRSPTGHLVMPLVALVLGMMLGVGAVFLYGLLGGGPVVIVPSAVNGNIIVEADKTYLTQLVTKNLRDSGMPGQIENVRVDLAPGNQMTVSGDDVLSVLGIGVARHFTFVVQPYVSSCFLHIHI